MSSPDMRKQLQLKAKLDSMLRKQKEQLKKDIAKKRHMQETEIKREVGEEIESIMRAAAAQNAAECENSVSSAAVFATNTTLDVTTPVSTRPKRKRNESGGAKETPAAAAAAAVASTNSVQHNSTSPPAAKKKKRNSSSAAAAAANNASSAAVKAGIVKKDKLYCVCKKKYDPSK